MRELNSSFVSLVASRMVSATALVGLALCLLSYDHARAQKSAFPPFADVGDEEAGPVIAPKLGKWDRGNPIPDWNNPVQVSSVKFYSEGWGAHLKGNLDSAITNLNQAITVDKNFTLAYYERAFVYRDKKDFDRALADIDHAIGLSPRDAQLRVARGDIRRTKGDLDGAFADFDDAIRLSPNFGWAYVSRGDIFYLRHDLNSAFGDYDRATHDYNAASDAYVGLGNVYTDNGKLDNAFAAYTKAAALDSRSADALVGLGNVYLKKSNAAEAIKSYSKAITLNRNLAIAYFQRSQAYQMSGLNQLAQQNFDEAIRLQMNPRFNFNLPGDLDPTVASSLRSIRLASPPIPDLKLLQDCKQRAKSKDDFYACMVDQAIPKEYRLTRECLARNQDDRAAALICSTGRSDLVTAYKRFRQVDRCVEAGDTTSQKVASCLGQQFLGPNEQYYLGCVTRNAGSYAGMAICAIAKDLTPEQQIALSCVVESGGVVYLYAVCVGGQLTGREIAKCWDAGVATPEGCFGPNNEIRKFYDSVDNQMKEIFGENNEGYKIFHRLKENDLTPGPNHELVKFINNGLGDIKNGPGKNNEFVKAGNAVSDAVSSVGAALGL